MAKRGTLCVYEAEETALFVAMQARKRGFAQYTTAEQRGQVRGKWLYGEYLRTEAEKYAIPVLPARPYDTALSRALHLLNA